LIKYRYLGLKAAVKCLLGSDFIEALDYQTCFETLRDHNTVQSWLDSLRLEAEGRIPKGYSLEDLRAAKLTEVKEDADRLDHVAIDKKEYDRLLSTEKKYWQNVRARDGWAADLI